MASTVALRGRSSRARFVAGAPKLSTVVQAPSLGALRNARPAKTQLINGDPFILELSLKLPFGFAFDAPGVERFFKAPPGMRVVDIHSESSRKAVVEMVVVDDRAAAMSQDCGGCPEAPMGFLVIGTILGFIAANWVLIVLVGIALAVLVGAVTGKAPLRAITEPVGNVLKIGSILIGGLIVLSVLGKVPNR